MLRSANPTNWVAVTIVLDEAKCFGQPGDGCGKGGRMESGGTERFSSMAFPSRERGRAVRARITAIG